MDEYVYVFKTMGEPTRLRILNLFIQEKNNEFCVCEIVDILQESQYNISRHLRALVKAGLATYNKQGKWSYYRLKENLDPFRENLLHSISSIPEEVFSADLERLHQRLALRVDGKCVIGFGKNQSCT